MALTSILALFHDAVHDGLALAGLELVQALPDERAVIHDGDVAARAEVLCRSVGDVAYDRTSFAIREEGKEWVGTGASLWGITAAVYLALMGPQGMVKIGEGIMQRVRYASKQLGLIDGVKAPLFDGSHFKEFVVSFDGTGRSVTEINRALLARGIFGGKDLTEDFPKLGECALYCVTEMHTREDIDSLVTALKEEVG